MRPERFSEKVSYKSNLPQGLFTFTTKGASAAISVGR